jgi:gas vesicle protein
MKKEKQKGKKGGISNTTAGAMGAAVGGIVGAAAGIALSDKEKRKMIMQKMDDLRKYVNGALDEISHMSQDSTEMLTPQNTPAKHKKTTTAKRSVN